MNTVAVVGCGAWGKNLVRNMAELGALRLVCDLDAARVDALAAAHRCEATTRFEDVLSRNEVQGVVLATPAKDHYAMGLAVLAAGKDLFVEKPIALSAHEGRRLVDAARSASRMLLVGHVLEYHPAVQALKERIEQGALGRVVYVYSNRLNLGKVRTEENALWSFAPHDVALICRLFGEVPAEVSACGGEYLQAGIADVTVTQMRFRSGARAHVFVSWLHPFKEQRLVVVGERKMASFDDVNKELILHDKAIRKHETGFAVTQGDGETIPFAADEPLRLECRAFLESMQTRVPPLTDGESGIRTLRVLEAAQRSMEQSGRPVRLKE